MCDNSDITNECDNSDITKDWDDLFKTNCASIAPIDSTKDESKKTKREYNRTVSGRCKKVRHMQTIYKQSFYTRMDFKKLECKNHVRMEVIYLRRGEGILCTGAPGLVQVIVAHPEQ